MELTENQRVREVRLENKLTMEKFGERLGITKSAISLIESGRSSVTLTIRRFISREFHVREEWLETGRGEKYVKREAEAEVAEAIGNFLEGENPEMKIRLAKLLSTVTDDDLWILETKLWEILTGEVLTQEQVKERVLAGKAPVPMEPKNVHDFTREELHKAIDREADLLERDTLSDSGTGNSGTASA